MSSSSINAPRPFAVRQIAVYRKTLKCEILRIYPERGMARVKFSNSMDRTVALADLDRYIDTPDVTT